MVVPESTAVPTVGLTTKEYTNASPSGSVPDSAISSGVFSTAVNEIFCAVGASFTPWMATDIVAVAVKDPSLTWYTIVSAKAVSDVLV
jgi:hypothetical protein